MTDRVTKPRAGASRRGGPKILFAAATPLAQRLRRELAEQLAVAGAVRKLDRLRALARRVKPQVIILDVELAGVRAIRAARQLRAELPEAKLVLLGTHAAPEAVSEAITAGASGFVRKDAGVSGLLDAIEAVLRGESYLPPARDAVSVPPPGDLTTRQRQVLELIVAGLSNKEMAHRLSISVKTVEFHKANLMARLRLRTTAALVKYALRYGLTQV